VDCHHEVLQCTSGRHRSDAAFVAWEVEQGIWAKAVNDIKNYARISRDNFRTRRAITTVYLVQPLTNIPLIS